MRVVKALAMSDFTLFNWEFPEYSDVQLLCPAEPVGHTASYVEILILASVDWDTVMYVKKKKKDANSASKVLMI